MESLNENGLDNELTPEEDVNIDDDCSPLQEEGNKCGRRKSSVFFSSVLETYDDDENEHFKSNESYEIKIGAETLLKRSFFKATSSSGSMFSRMSEYSFTSNGGLFKCFIISCSVLMIFLMGVIVGAMVLKQNFGCSAFSIEGN